MSNPRVLYIVYWGAAEPLGQSLVLPAVKQLAGLGAQITLVTFEKPADLARPEQTAGIRQSLEVAGVRWLPLRYHKRPKVPATAFDVAQGCARSVAAHLGSRFDIIHARTFIAGLAGLVLAPMLRAKLVYHNEGFYPDEQVDAGVWAHDSPPHRIAKALEGKLYATADGIIALSNRAKISIEQLEAVRRKGTPVVVVPSSVDLDHFSRKRAPRTKDELRFAYIGSVGGRYRLDMAARLAVAAQRCFNHVRLDVLTQSDPALAHAVLSQSGLDESQWTLGRVPYTEMPDRLASEHVGLHFLNAGLSGHGGSPTKIGEYWAMGLPVVTTPNAGDTSEIIRRERVGVVVDGDTEEAYSEAVGALHELLQDDSLGERCRRAAETHYALGPACERQLDLYREVRSQ